MGGGDLGPNRARVLFGAVAGAIFGPLIFGLVKTGGQDESYWEIADGLREGDEVLVGETKPEGKENAGP